MVYPQYDCNTASLFTCIKDFKYFKIIIGHMFSLDNI